MEVHRMGGRGKVEFRGNTSTFPQEWWQVKAEIQQNADRNPVVDGGTDSGMSRANSKDMV
jgi:hypothetical protein